MGDVPGWGPACGRRRWSSICSVIMFLTEMPRTQLLRYCCRRLGFGPLTAPSLSERFPLRPQGSLIFGEKEPPSPEPAFKKNIICSAPHFSKSVFLSLPSAFPSYHLLFPLRFSLGLSRSLPRKAGLNQPPSCLSLSYTHFSFPPFLGKLALFICPL